MNVLASLRGPLCIMTVLSVRDVRGQIALIRSVEHLPMPSAMISMSCGKCLADMTPSVSSPIAQSPYPSQLNRHENMQHSVQSTPARCYTSELVLVLAHEWRGTSTVKYHLYTRACVFVS